VLAAGVFLLLGFYIAIHLRFSRTTQNHLEETHEKGALDTACSVGQEKRNNGQSRIIGKRRGYKLVENFFWCSTLIFKGKKQAKIARRGRGNRCAGAVKENHVLR